MQKTNADKRDDTKKNNFELKTNKEVLEEIRQKRIQELKEEGKDNVTIPLVEYIGDGSISGKRLFRMIEKVEQENGEIKYEDRFYSFDEEQIQAIAVRNENTGKEIMPLEVKGWMDSYFTKDEIEHCLEEREKRLEEIAKKMGLSPEEIDNLSEIDLEQKVAEAQEKGKEQKANGEKKTGEETKLTEKQAGSIDYLNELNTNTEVDSRGTTLEKALKLDELGYSKILVVHAHKLAEISGQREDIKFGFVGVKPNGSMEAISTDKIRMYRGDNTEAVNIKNPQEIETSSNDYTFEIVGTNRKLFINQKDTKGRTEVYLAQASRDNDGNVAQKLPDQYKGTEKSDIEVRDLFSSYHGENQIENSYDEAKSHEEVGCNDLSLDEVDGDKTTGHQHDNRETSDENIIEQIAVKCRVSRKEAERYYEEICKENDNKELSREEIIDEAQDKAIEEMGGKSRVR